MRIYFVFYLHIFLAAVSCPAGSTGNNVAAGCVCNIGCIGSINASKIGPNFYVGQCGCAPITEFKTTGPFTWTAPFTGTLSVVVVAGGGGGGLLQL